MRFVNGWPAGIAGVAAGILVLGGGVALGDGGATVTAVTAGSGVTAGTAVTAADGVDGGVFASVARNPLHPAPVPGDATVTDLPVEVDTFPWWKDHGIASYRQIRDAGGRLLQQIYFDAKGRQIRNGDGVGSYLSRYFTGGSEQWVLDIDGKLMLRQEGWSYSMTMSTDDGRLTRTETYGLDGKLTNGNQGWAVMVRESDARGRKIRETRWGADGGPASGNGTWATRTFQYREPDGAVTSTCFDAAGANMPCPASAIFK